MALRVFPASVPLVARLALVASGLAFTAPAAADEGGATPPMTTPPTSAAAPVPAYAAEADGESEGETESRVGRGFSAGFLLQRWQDDFGMSGELSTPSFAGDWLKVSLAGGIAWYPGGTGANGAQEWTPYGQSRLVVQAGHRVYGAPIRLYGFGGPTLLVLPSELSSHPVVVGGIGGFGFEFFFRERSGEGPVTYFMEMGGVGAGGVATQVATQPSFASGFLLTVGLRVYP